MLNLNLPIFCENMRVIFMGLTILLSCLLIFKILIGKEVKIDLAYQTIIFNFIMFSYLSEYFSSDNQIAGLWFFIITVILDFRFAVLTICRFVVFIRELKQKEKKK